jgi:hypothetical protein
MYISQRFEFANKRGNFGFTESGILNRPRKPGHDEKTMADHGTTPPTFFLPLSPFPIFSLIIGVVKTEELISVGGRKKRKETSAHTKEESLALRRE